MRSLFTLRKILNTGVIVNVTEPIDLGLNFEVFQFYVDENFVVLGVGIREDPYEEVNFQPYIQIRSTQNLHVVHTFRIFYRLSERVGYDYTAIVQDYSGGLLIEQYTPDWALANVQMKLPLIMEMNHFK